MYTATKEFNFEAGHSLWRHPGKCANVHGHNYKVLVTLCSESLNDMEMVMDFYDLNKFAKPLFDQFDHAYMYNAIAYKHRADEFEAEIVDVLNKYERKTYPFPGRAAAENMSKYFYVTLNGELAKTIKGNVRVSKVTVYETPTSFATYEE